MRLSLLDNRRNFLLYLDENKSIPKYTIIWKNWDGSVIETDYNVLEGGTPAYNSPTPTKPSTNLVRYEFAGWNPSVSSVTGDTIYTATFTEIPITYQVSWFNYDATLIKMEEVQAGTVPVYSGTTPIKPSTAISRFEFSGWDPTPSAVSGDISYTAVFTEIANTVTATFVRASDDGGGTLATVTVTYGETPVYNGPTPTTTKGDTTQYTFNGWTPALGPITSDTTYTAKFNNIQSLTVQYISCTMAEYTSQLEEVAIEEFSGSWSDLIDSIDDGSYLTTYKLGQYKTVDFGSEGNIQMQIIAFNKDVDEDGNCIPITLLSRKQLSGGGVAFGSNNNTFVSWTNSNVRTQLYSRILNNIPEPLKSRLIPCVKYTCDTEANRMSIEELFIPSRGELFDTLPSNGSYTSETMGPVYSGLFIPKSGWYWTRSKVAVNNRALQYCQGGNLIAEGQNTYQYDIYFGFCIGRVKSN